MVTLVKHDKKLTSPEYHMARRLSFISSPFNRGQVSYSFYDFQSNCYIKYNFFYRTKNAFWDFCFVFTKILSKLVRVMLQTQREILNDSCTIITWYTGHEKRTNPASPSTFYTFKFCTSYPAVTISFYLLKLLVHSVCLLSVVFATWAVTINKGNNQSQVNRYRSRMCIYHSYYPWISLLDTCSM